MRWLAVVAALIIPSSLAAEIMPEPGADNPRIQSVRWRANETVQLAALPGTSLTVLFESGESVSVAQGDASLLDIRISPERDGLQLVPLREGSLGLLRVTTTQRAYTFSVRTGRDLMAAYLVRFESSPSKPPGIQIPVSVPVPPPPLMSATPATESTAWRIRGDRAVQPVAVSDDGARTYITFSQGSALPAIFALGPTGEEQVVNGYMRGDRFVIDQVWTELVFRIDAQKATARRDARRGSVRG